MSDPKKSLDERMDEMPGLRERFEAILTIAVTVHRRVKLCLRSEKEPAPAWTEKEAIRGFANRASEGAALSTGRRLPAGRKRVSSVFLCASVSLWFALVLSRLTSAALEKNLPPEHLFIALGVPKQHERLW